MCLELTGKEEQGTKGEEREVTQGDREISPCRPYLVASCRAAANSHLLPFLVNTRLGWAPFNNQTAMLQNCKYISLGLRTFP